MSLKKDGESWDGNEHDESQLSDESHKAQIGVQTVEAAQKVYGPHSKWFLFLGYVVPPTQPPRAY
jgi:hypothetical protein